MLVVERDGLLQGGVADDIAVRKVFSDDAGAGFVFLRNVVLVLGGVVGSGGAAGCLGGGVAGYLDLGGSELGVVEEERGLRGSEMRSVAVW